MVGVGGSNPLVPTIYFSFILKMLTITFKDGSQKQFEKSISILEIANSISPNLAKAAILAKVNDRLVDLSFLVEEDATIIVLKPEDPEGLEVIRHSTAHLLAHAVKELYPETQVTIGPVIENGFYYDFSRPQAFSEEDLEVIEKKMHEIAARQYPVERYKMEREKAISFFQKQGETYKAEIIKDLPKEEVITLYKQGDFSDLCRGPHVPNTRFLKAFKLTRVSGAYWRGDSKNEMLQRIYGTAWADQKSLRTYLKKLEEAEKRDHRKLAKKMDLFHFQEEAPGMVFWHENGWILYRLLENYVRQIAYRSYQEVRTPQLLDRILWEKSGHWSKFGEDSMFQVHSEERNYVLKPMNCPCHIQVFNDSLKSYRDLPLRLAEFGACHRNEPSGSLHGLMRVRNFTQDDGHIFCTLEQVESEVSQFIQELFQIYQAFGFKKIEIKFSTRPEKRVGSEEIWDLAESALSNILDKMNLDWELQEGEGAFYGPKIEFSLKDCLDRIWQCGTMQLDFVMPERLGAYYIAEDSSKKTPVMLHRAVLGSLERFIGILIEHYNGNLPFWLAPKQITVLNVTSESVEYARQVEKKLKKEGFRTILDIRNEKIGLKIREHTIARVPYLIILGKQEMETQKVSVRLQSGEGLGDNVSFADLLDRLKKENQPLID
jgi:threonyl-tRNA synthetase